MTTYFISDLHLSAKDPKTSELFLKFLDQDLKNAQALYILGDFFDSWIGDDNPDPHYHQIMQTLAEVNQSGIPVYIMHGNRDFLMGDQFIKDSNCTLLADPTVIHLFDKKIVLSHGDQLCTLDKKYQWFRRFVRHPLVQKAFLKLPLSWRITIASWLRKNSTRTKINNHQIPRHCDVVSYEVYKLLREYGASTLIHGHTHQPKIEEFILDGQPAKRIVLGDWENTGIILAYSAEGLELKSIL